MPTGKYIHKENCQCISCRSKRGEYKHIYSDICQCGSCKRTRKEPLRSLTAEQSKIKGQKISDKLSNKPKSISHKKKLSDAWKRMMGTEKYDQRMEKMSISQSKTIAETMSTKKNFHD